MTKVYDESRLVQLFNEKKEKTTRKKELSFEVNGLKVNRARLYTKINGLQEAKREAYLSFLGKGKYGEIIMTPVRLQGELNNLEHMANNKYEGKTDVKAVKAYEGKAPVYQEDIELAKEEALAAEKEVDDILKEYFELVAVRKELNKLIRRKIFELSKVTRRLKKIDKEIKKTDKALTKELTNGRTK